MVPAQFGQINLFGDFRNRFKFSKAVLIPAAHLIAVVIYFFVWYFPDATASAKFKILLIWLSRFMLFGF